MGRKIDSEFFEIPMFSNYRLSKSGKLFNKAANEIQENEAITDKIYQLYGDDGFVHDIKSQDLMSIMQYGPNHFPLYPIYAKTFISKDVKIDMVACYQFLEFESHDKFYIMNKEFRRYKDTDLYLTQDGNILNGSTGTIIKVPQDGRGYYGLGRHYYGGLRVHRMIYETYVGPIPDGYVIDHLDCKPWHNEPSNFEPVTVAENNKRAIMNHCNANYLSWDIAKKMCDDLSYPNPLHPKLVAEKYGVSIAIPRFIVQGKTWKELAKDYKFPKYCNPSNSEINDIRNDFKNGWSYNYLSEKYGYADSIIDRVIKSAA